MGGGVRVVCWGGIGEGWAGWGIFLGFGGSGAGGGRVRVLLMGGRWGLRVGGGGLGGGIVG